jgi:drug/metabolite transporter (DMT)-like permease
MTESFLTGVVWILLSATSMAFVGLFAELGFDQMSLTAMIFGRFSAAFLICLIWTAISGQLKHFRFTHIKMNIYRSFFLCASQYCFFYYIQHNTLLNGIVLLNTSPLFMPFIERRLFGNTIGVSSWVGLIVSFIGVLCILQPGLGLWSWPSLIGLFAGLSQGISQVLFGVHAKKENGQLSVLLLTGFMVLFSIVPYLLINVPTLEPSARLSLVMGIWVLLGLASVFNQFARGVAYKHATPSRLSPFLYVSVLWAGMLDWVVFNQVPNLLSVFGAGLVVLGGVLKVYLRYKILRIRK